MDSSNYNKINTKLNFDELVFNNNKIIGKGAFGNVYNAYNGKNMNNRMVVKKTKKNIGLQLFSFLVNGKFQGKMFDEEIRALKYLSKIGIAPKIYFSNKEKMIYVIEKLDCTLYELLKKKKFTPNHLTSLIKTLKKLQKTKFVHEDLHDGNIMYNKKNNKFYVIDWGIFRIKKECYSNSNTKKKSIKRKSNICYQYNSKNVNALSNVFYYISQMIQNNKKWEKVTQNFLKLFNLKDLKDADSILLNQKH